MWGASQKCLGASQKCLGARPYKKMIRREPIPKCLGTSQNVPYKMLGASRKNVRARAHTKKWNSPKSDDYQHTSLLHTGFIMNTSNLKKNFFESCLVIPGLSNFFDIFWLTTSLLYHVLCGLLLFLQVTTDQYHCSTSASCIYFCFWQIITSGSLLLSLRLFVFTLENQLFLVFCCFFFFPCMYFFFMFAFFFVFFSCRYRLLLSSLILLWLHWWNSGSNLLPSGGM
jgi:hypothetical protein